MKHKILKIKVVAIPVPKKNGKKWNAFCEKHGIHQLGGPRRGWWGEAGTYIRGADYLLFYDGMPVDVAFQREIDEGEIIDEGETREIEETQGEKT